MHGRTSALRGTIPLLIALGVALLVTGPVASADGSTASTPPQVHDFAEILVGDLRITPDPSGRAATVEVTTSIDAACAVIYGADETFGHIATDQDMGGGAHRDHRPMLTGLEPDSTVFFRLQGSGPDGRMYASETFTFQTAAGHPEALVNLALEATVVDVSSEHSALFAAANAIDGDPGTEWSSRGDGDDAFITLDLGREAAIGAVVFRTRSMADGSSITETFSLSVDGEHVGTFPAGDEPVPVTVTGQVVRFDVETSTGGNTGAIEIAVHEVGEAG
jgi:hypothetical protein